MTIDPYNSLKYYINKDIVESGGLFVLVINSQCEDH